MGRTAARGYGGAHQALRRALAPVVAAGGVACSRCGRLIEQWQSWDLDHRDDRMGYLGPSHASCNRGEANRRRRRARDATAIAVAWAQRENAYWAEVERQAERPPPRPAIY